MSALKPSNHAAAGETSDMIRPEPFASDEDYTYRLQIIEEMTVSLALQPSSSTESPLNAAVSSSSHSQQQTLALDLKLANENKERFSDMGESSKSTSDEVFRVYFKGLLVNDESCVWKPKVVGIGVAICDESDGLLFEMSKAVNLMNGEWMNNHVVAAKALIEGLSAALNMGFKNLVFFCDYLPLYQMVTRQWSPKQEKLAMLLNKVESLRKKFTTCMPSFVARNEVKIAFKLAREAIINQTNKHAESSGTKIEACAICLEDVDLCRIFSVDGCMHRYCFSCMKQHVEVKLLNVKLPKCPHEGCTSVLKLDSCQKFLTPKLIEIMSERLTEAAIPVTEKIYCPYPRCSALMSRTDINAEHLYPDVQDSGVRKCMKCHGLFCVNCKVPWHSNMTCYEFQKDNFNQNAEDVKLKTLAAQNLWHQCVKCNHMIELGRGCNHVTCRCGYEFCYSCGSEWKNKKATCTCLLWDDNNSVDDDYDDDDYGEFEDIGMYEDYFDFGSDYYDHFVNPI